MSYDPLRTFRLQLTETTRRQFKLKVIELGMTMQWMLSELVNMVVEGDPVIMRRLTQAVARRRKEEANRLYHPADVESIFACIESDTQKADERSS